MIVITAGGGGIPVIETKDGFSGIDGVIDKDFASSLLANEVNAQKLIILTAVDNVCVNFGKPNEKKLNSLSLHDAQTYIDEQQFAVGSMLPKVQAAMAFVKAKPNNVAIIANLNQAKKALLQQVGTVITNK